MKKTITTVVLVLIASTCYAEKASTKRMPTALRAIGATQADILTTEAAHKVRAKGGGPVCWAITAAGTDGAMLPICIRGGNGLGIANGWIGGADNGIAGMHRNLPYRQGYPSAGADRGVSLR